MARRLLHPFIDMSRKLFTVLAFLFGVLASFPLLADLRYDFVPMRDNLLDNSEVDFTVRVFDNLTTDSDGDTVADFFDNCQDIANLEQEDRDEDGFGDVCDVDNETETKKKN